MNLLSDETLQKRFESLLDVTKYNKALNTQEFGETSSLTNAKLIKVRELLSDKVPAIQSVPTEELEQVFRDLLVALAKQNVFVDFMYPVSLSEAYRFTSEELLEKQVDLALIPYQPYRFLYETFYPNIEEDTKALAGKFVEAILENNWKILRFLLGDQPIKNVQGQALSPEQWLNQVALFHQKHSHIQGFVVQPVSSVLFDQDKEATVSLSVKWQSHAWLMMGQATIDLAYACQYGWCIRQAKLPAFPTA